MHESGGAVADKIKGLISVLAHEGVCDACIVARLNLAHEHQASHRTRTLAGETGFERLKSACAICGEDRVVTRRNV